MATHLPMNHRLRPYYRALAGATGVFLIGFGIASLVAAWGDPFFAQGGTKAWGLHTNLAFGVLSIVVGAVILVGVIIGNNVDRTIDLAGSLVFIVAGLIMLPLSRSSLNFLNYDVTAAVVSFAIGSVLGIAGLYGRVGTHDRQEHEEGFRHGSDRDPVRHNWSKLPPKRPKESKFA